MICWRLWKREGQEPHATQVSFPLQSFRSHGDVATHEPQSSQLWRVLALDLHFLGVYFTDFYRKEAGFLKQRMIPSFVEEEQKSKIWCPVCEPC